MRPPKRILLAGDGVNQVHLLRFLLWTHHFAVVTTYSAAEAEWLMRQMSADAAFDLLLVIWPLEGAAELLERAKEIDPATRSLLLSDSVDGIPLGFQPDMTLWAKLSNADILERIKVLTARKRGPRPIPKPSPSPH